MHRLQPVTKNPFIILSKKPDILITGRVNVSKQCQFCVNDTALPLENDTSTRIVPSLITLFAFFFHPRENYRDIPPVPTFPVQHFMSGAVFRDAFHGQDNSGHLAGIRYRT